MRLETFGGDVAAVVDSYLGGRAAHAGIVAKAEGDPDAGQLHRAGDTEPAIATSATDALRQDAIRALAARGSVLIREDPAAGYDVSVTGDINDIAGAARAALAAHGKRGRKAFVHGGH